MKIKRLKSKGKGKNGKRWVKGNSCVSNPEKKTHRENAMSSFFQENLGKKTSSTSLTLDALKKHDIYHGDKEVSDSPAPETDMAVDSRSSNANGTFKTFQTFASDWTNCTNQSFGRLMNSFRADSSQHKEMLAILAAITEVIKSHGGKETDTEFYGALMISLEVSETEENTAGVLQLLSMNIKKVPQNVLRLKFEESCRLFINMLIKFMHCENTIILRSLIGCLSILLRAQDLNMWKPKHFIFEVYETMLGYVQNSKPKVRKAARHAVCAILRGSVLEKEKLHPAAGFTGQTCIQILESAAAEGRTSSMLHVLGLLSDIAGGFPKAEMKLTFETCAKVLTLGDPIVTSCAMHVLYCILSSHPPKNSLSSGLNARLINALYEFQPSDGDTQAVSKWLVVLQEALNNLAIINIDLCLANIPQFADYVAKLWLSEKVEQMRLGAHALKDVIDHLSSEGNNSSHFQPTLRKLLGTLEGCLKFQYHASWKYVIYVLGAVYQMAGVTYFSHCSTSLKLLVALRETDKFSLADDVDRTVGVAVRALGPKFVLEIIPFQITGDDPTNDFHRSWLLPILKDNIKGSELKFFAQNILPIATLCWKRSQEFGAQKEQIISHSYFLLYVQLWALLPSFCNSPTDIKENFKHIAQNLGENLKNRKDIRLSIMASLRQLVGCSLEFPEQRSELARFSKNFLPILLNLYTTPANSPEEEDQRLAVLETIKIYLKLTSPELCLSFMDLAFDKLKNLPLDENNKKHKKKDSSTERDALLKLLGALVPYQDMARLDRVCKQCISFLESTDHKLQKQAYRILEEICKVEADTCQKYSSENTAMFLKTFSESLSTSKLPSRAPRLRCLLHLIKNLDKKYEAELKAMIPEAILCCKDINERCRSAAFTLLIEIGRTLQEWSNEPVGDAIRGYFAIILIGLNGSPNLISATILALAFVVHEYSKILPSDVVELLMHNMCVLLTSSGREVVGSAFSLFKTMLSMYSRDSLLVYVPDMVKSLVNMTEDCKRHFRLKGREMLVRLTRKFGIDHILAFVPQEDTVMRLRLKNIRKEEDRKNRNLNEQKHEGRRGRQSEVEREEDDDPDLATRTKNLSIEEILAESEESDFDTEETKIVPKRKRTKPNTWIQESSESFVDFTDPSAAKKITATKPQQESAETVKVVKDKNRGFKTASDGRLIITNESDSEEEGGRKGKGCKKIPIFSNDSDNDDISETRSHSPGRFVKAPGLAKKRKASDAGSDVFSQPASKYQAGGSGIHRPFKSQPGTNSVNHTGTEYKAKKARGDVKKKGKLEPYAYVPLSGNLLNKRKHAKQAGQLKKIIISAKKGAKHGIRAKAKNVKNKSKH